MSARVLILGGGFAGLETAYSLSRQLGGAAHLTLVSNSHTFLFKPNTIYLPFGGDESRLHIPLVDPLRRRQITYYRSGIAEVDPDRKQVSLDTGARLSYDYLVLATGSAMRPEEIPGLAEHAVSIWTPVEMRRLGSALHEICAAAGRGEDRKVLFVVPPNNKCAGPLYEIVFMLETWLRRQMARDRVEIAWTTYEESYIQAFGPRLHRVVTREFARRGIEGRTGKVLSEVKPGSVTYVDGSTETFDLLVSFPPYVAAVDYPGLPTDDRGFLRTEPTARRVDGHPDIYAPGDAGDFPVKQAFLAFLQADAVADDIADRIRPRAGKVPRAFDPVSMCVMEMFDTATFAQVPLETTGDPARPIRVREDTGGLYRVGISPLWRIGKKALGIYLPWRFAAGRPFHEGLPWKGMEVALKGMSRVLASSRG